MDQRQRGQESPMDFQWENVSGRVDPNSPFRMSGVERTLGAQQQTPIKRGAQAIFQTSPTKQSIFQTSPIKQPIFSTPSATPFAPSTPFANLGVPPPFRAPSFQTPRNINDSPSKDSDVFSTPGDQDTDNEMNTPDQLSHLFRSGRKGGPLSLGTPREVVREAPRDVRASGRGELRRGKYHEGAISKAPRRRRQSRHRRSISDDDDDSDDDDTDYVSRSPRKSRRKNAESGESPSERWLQTHTNIPKILAEYLNLFMYASWIMVVVYILFSVVQAVRQDMEHKVQIAAEGVMEEIATCSRQFLQNRCAPDTRLPALEAVCAQWERCINQDPAKVGRSKVGASTIAAIINEFVTQLHWKTSVFVVVLAIGCVFASRRLSPITATPPPPPPPPTPQYPTSSIPTWTPHPSYYEQGPWTTPLTSRKRRSMDYGTPNDRGRTLNDEPTTPTDSIKSLAWR